LKPNNNRYSVILKLVLSSIIEPTGAISEFKNQINITVVFLDSSLPTPTNGGFQNEEEFRKYLLEHQNGKWETKMTVRPTSKRERNYNNNTFEDAFLLQFPYGHTGLQTDPAVIELNDHPIQKHNKVFKKLL
jgi:hypothetical protein